MTSVGYRDRQMTAHPPTDDSVLARRNRAARLAGLGRRSGYSLFGIAIMVFLMGLIIDFNETTARVIIACLVVGSIMLAPAIITGYAVKAAIRDDLEHGREIR